MEKLTETPLLSKDLKPPSHESFKSMMILITQRGYPIFDSLAYHTDQLIFSLNPLLVPSEIPLPPNMINNHLKQKSNENLVH